MSISINPYLEDDFGESDSPDDHAARGSTSAAESASNAYWTGLVNGKKTSAISSYSELADAKHANVQSGEDDYNNISDSMNGGGHDAEDLMPEGWADSRNDRDAAVSKSLTSDSSVLAPTREDLEETYLRRLDSMPTRGQDPATSSKNGMRSLVWPLHHMDPDANSYGEHK